jgi:hypothetical protein
LPIPVYLGGRALVGDHDVGCFILPRPKEPRAPDGSPTKSCQREENCNFSCSKAVHHDNQKSLSAGRELTFFLLKSCTTRQPKKFVSRKRIDVFLAQKLYNKTAKKICQQETNCIFFGKKMQNFAILFLLTNQKFFFRLVSRLVSADFEKTFFIRFLNKNLYKKIFLKSAETNLLTNQKIIFRFVSRKRIAKFCIFFAKKRQFSSC